MQHDNEILLLLACRLARGLNYFYAFSSVLFYPPFFSFFFFFLAS